jgi:predicted phage baseplate assembly protein
MALRDHFPPIDDRTYEDLVAEIRARVARYTPEWKPGWNDVNDSDPGVTLAQVFAWLSEMLLYRMNRVPALNYLKFLELIGIELQPARPAIAEIAFPVAQDWPQDWVDVPPRTQVSAAGADGKPLVFETVRALRAAACELRNVQTYDSAQYADATARNAEPREGFLPFGAEPRDGGALALGFWRPAGKAFPALTLDIALWSIEPPAAEAGRTPPRVQACGPISTRAYAPALLQWEGWNGVRWTPLDSLNDETLAFTRSGHVRVRIPAGAALARSYLGAYESGEPLFWLRARLARTQYERAPRLLAVRINTAPAEQAQTVRNEILGGADGRRDQRWQLANTPVIAGSLRVGIEQGTGEPEWTVRDDLFGARHDEQVLALNRASGELQAGDGENGAVPVANPANPDASVVALEYRFGGGEAGNVAAGEIRTLVTPVEGIDTDKVGNPLPASGGAGEERLHEAERRARLSLRARERAVTPEDFELLAGQAGNVRRARALPLAHPQFPGVRVPGAITVVVVPESDSAAPSPSDALLRTVCEYLDARRLLTTEVFVVAPRYLALEVQAQVVVADDADRGAVKEKVEAALSEFLHPLKGGDERDGWPFGGALRYSKIVQRAFVDGVESVLSLRLTLEGAAQPECRDVPIEANALLNLTGLEVTVLARSEAEETVA